MAAMDPRQLRTRNTLRATVYEIAATKPIGSVSVAEIARAAGVTRDTVYRHAADPVQLLAGFLDEEMAEFVLHSAELPATAPKGRTVFDDGERELLAHIVAHAEVYRHAMSPRLIGPLRDVLIDRIGEGLRGHLDRHPEIAPRPADGTDPELHARMLIAYAAAGTVAAIETWLEHGDLDDPDSAARTVLAASPEWWLGRDRL